MNDNSDVELGADMNLEPTDLTNPSHLTQLSSVWDCPKIVHSKEVSAAGHVWACAWCPNDNNGQHTKPFIQWNSSEAFYHVLKIKGYSICPCNGFIPPEWEIHYTNICLCQAMDKEKKEKGRDQLKRGIQDMQEGFLSAITPSTSTWYFFLLCCLFVLLVGVISFPHSHSFPQRYWPFWFTRWTKETSGKRSSGPQSPHWCRSLEFCM